MTYRQAHKVAMEMLEEARQAQRESDGHTYRHKMLAALRFEMMAIDAMESRESNDSIAMAQLAYGAGSVAHELGRYFESWGSSMHDAIAKSISRDIEIFDEACRGEVADA